MIWAATMGLPLSLEGVGAVLGLEKQKLTEGKRSDQILLCALCSDKGKRRSHEKPPFHAPDKWEAFKNITSVMWKPRSALKIVLPNSL